ncbi:MAG: KGK domain-containing protein [Heteroscytonema crispum UTEX LB 1556]
MSDELKPIKCNDDDVLASGDNTYKIGKFRKAVNESFNSSMGYRLDSELESKGVRINTQSSKIWFTEGIDCEILNLGSKTWKKAKVKIKINVEFYTEEEENPEIIEPESPLDDIRRMINSVTL